MLRNHWYIYLIYRMHCTRDGKWKMENLRHPDNMSNTQWITNLLVVLSRLENLFFIHVYCIPYTRQQTLWFLAYTIHNIHTLDVVYGLVTFSWCCVNFDVNIMKTSQHKYVRIHYKLHKLSSIIWNAYIFTSASLLRLLLSFWFSEKILDIFLQRAV